MYSHKSLDVVSNTEGYVMREVLRFAMFVSKPHREIADVVNEVVCALVDRFPPPAINSFAANSGDWLVYGVKELKNQTFKRLVGRDHPINASLSLGGDEFNIPDHAIEYKGLAIDLPLYAEACCALWFHLPIAYAEQGCEAVTGLFLPIAERLGSTSGYVDIALEGHQPRMQVAAKRFLGVDISDVTCVARDLNLNVPGVHWINYFGPELLEHLATHGVNVQSAPQGGTLVSTQGGGALLTLGQEPDLCDVTRPDTIASRRTLASQLHAAGLLHVPTRFTYFDAEEDVDEIEAQRRWHLRLAQ